MTSKAGARTSSEQKQPMGSNRSVEPNATIQKKVEANAHRPAPLQISKVSKSEPVTPRKSPRSTHQSAPKQISSEAIEDRTPSTQQKGYNDPLLAKITSKPTKTSHAGELNPSSEAPKLELDRINETTGPLEGTYDHEKKTCSSIKDSSASAKISDGTSSLTKSSGSTKISDRLDFVESGKSSMCRASTSSDVSDDSTCSSISTNIFEVFLLGLDSTGSTTMWALGLLVHNQEAQEKLYQEIRDHATCTEEGIVKVEEVGKLEYLQAVVKETMRMKPIAPLAVLHKAARDTTLDGLHVAEGTPVMVNLYALHYDPKVWDGPDRFKPERFMESSKEFLGKRGQYSFLPFGAGMRACAGMEVGKLQLPFVVSNLVNALHWSNAVEGEEPNLSEDFSFILAMKTPLEARIVPRGI